ncbi:MAG: hypothetical protein MUP66_00820 [Candidatus Nanohaloarchaeota archaeon QJJ-5]|nr:hypothetical protein [Candidatus Nanohaloarchaeota archaeon QJJ-5]
MLDKFKMSHLQGFVLFLFIASVATALLYYYLLIDEASTYSEEEYACGNAYPIADSNMTANTSTQAHDIVTTYLEGRNISITQNLSVSSIDGVYRIDVPNHLYEGYECTFRDRGLGPPACIGQWFQVNHTTISMRYQVPCA